MKHHYDIFVYGPHGKPMREKATSPPISSYQQRHHQLAGQGQELRGHSYWLESSGKPTKGAGEGFVMLPDAVVSRCLPCLLLPHPALLSKESVLQVYTPASHTLVLEKEGVVRHIIPLTFLS